MRQLAAHRLLSVPLLARYSRLAPLAAFLCCFHCPLLLLSLLLFPLQLLPLPTLDPTQSNLPAPHALLSPLLTPDSPHNTADSESALTGRRARM